MRKIDPRLRHVLRDWEAAEAAMPALAGNVGMVGAEEDEEAPAAPLVEILVRCQRPDAEAVLRDAGMTIRTFLRGAVSVASGEISLDRLSALNEMGIVRQVESSREMVPEMDVSRIECGAETAHALNPAVRGAGVVVGIVDGGIDFTHPDFRKADGTSRILFLWDQGGQPVAGGTVPFGREFSQADLDASFQDATLAVPTADTLGHGTHVAGIAAGGDRSGSSLDGIAPEADLIMVAIRPEENVTLGRSVRVFEAFDYIVRRAAGRPVAINLSQGMNGGGHSGETVLEAGLDLLARRPGVVIVKSAGNEQLQRIHAGGRLAAGETRVLEFVVASNDSTDDVLELWFGGEDSISAALQPPGGQPFDFVAAGDDGSFVTPAGNEVTITSDLDADDTGDTRTTIILTRSTKLFLQPGTWNLHLRGDQIADGRFDVWIEREAVRTRFAPTSADPTRTVTVPGTAPRIITVGAYVTRLGTGSPPLGEISSFSSHGPSRYGLRKPEIAAPGEMILACRSQAMLTGNGLHRQDRGTSMAAPHVTGAAALILSVRPELTCEQVKQVLMSTARQTGAAVSAPDDTFGGGRLDVAAAVELARTVRFPVVSNVTVQGTAVSWDTDVATTGAVVFNSHRRRLQLGRSLGSQADLTPAAHHSVDLQGLGLPAGDYFFEVRAFNQDNFSTVEDNGGALHRITIP